MKKLILVPLLLALAVAPACSHRKIVKFKANELSTNNEASGNGLNMEVTSIKTKGKSTEITFTLENKYNHTVSFDGSSPKFTFNNQNGILMAKETLAPLFAGGTRKEKLRFDFSPATQKYGEGVLTLDPVLYNGKKGKQAHHPSLSIHIPVAK